MCLATSALAGPAPARNVILVSLDSVRADHLAMYGYPRNTMPELERRANQLGAQIFTRMTAVTPACHPSHTTMLTGVYPQEAGVPGCAEDMLRAEDQTEEEAWNELAEMQDELRDKPPPLRQKRLSAVMNWLRIPEDTPTLASFLQQQGFHTGGFVSIWTVRRRFGYARGFDRFVDDMPEYYGPPRLRWLLRDLMGGQLRQQGSATVDAALDYLGGIEPDRRFFVFLHLADAHVPYDPRDAPPITESIEQRARVEAAWRARYPPANFERAMKEMSRGNGEPLLDRYDHALRYLDLQLARLFSWLEHSGHLEDTLVVVTSDHGDSFGQHLYLSSRYQNRLFFEHSVAVWEETQHVPLLLFEPGGKGPAQRRPGNVSHVDLVPTVLAALGYRGFDDQHPLPGRDLEDELPEQRTVFFLTFGRGRPGLFRHLHLDFPKFAGLRRGDLKFFVDRDRFKNGARGRCFLFDLAEDPDEKHNLCPQSPEKAAVYRKQLVDWYSGSIKYRARNAEPP